MLKRRKAHQRGPSWSTAEEKALVYQLKTVGFDKATLQQIFPGRTLASIRSKVRKLRIELDLFGESYRKDKERFTTKIARAANPRIVFDAYAGAGHQTFRWIRTAHTVFASEKRKEKLAQFTKEADRFGYAKVKNTEDDWHLFKKGRKKIYLHIGDAIDAAAELKYNQVKIDLIDLDTCGSTLPTLPIFLTLLKPKHLVITHGEFHSLRFKRQDVLRRLLSHKDVTVNPIPLTVDQMSQELDRAVKIAALRAHNETTDSFWLKLRRQVWLGSKFHGMLRRHYRVSKPRATADCLNSIDG